VIKGFNKKVCLIVPLTTKLKENKFHYDIGSIAGKRACAILSQIRLVDTKRFINKISFVNNKRLFKLKRAIWKLIR